MKQLGNRSAIGLSMGICFGVAIGCAIGTATHRLAASIGIGAGVGCLVGLFIGYQKDKEVNAQVEQFGYTIQSINLLDDAVSSMVVIIDKHGSSKEIKMPNAELNAENLKVGDIVYLNEDGLVERAFDEGPK
jgi:hypothetical protein